MPETRFGVSERALALRSVLGWANIILGSLAGIVPGGDAIKEYKEAVERAIADEDGNDDAEDAQQPPFQPYIRSRPGPLSG